MSRNPRHLPGRIGSAYNARRMDRKVIEAYAAEAPELAKSIAGLSCQQMLAFPVPGTWSIQQIVLHIVDTDLVIADRMKRVIAEDNPTLLGFDQTKFTARLHYEEQDAALVCELFAKNRQAMAALLRLLKDEVFERAGTHSQRGRMTLGEIVPFASWHFQHHMKFLREKRAMV